LKKKIALITGINGQDGSYLAELLLNKNYIVHGIIRRASSINTKRLDKIFQNPLNEKRSFFLHYGDLTDGTFLNKLIDEILPDEIYNLAAQSHVKVSFDNPEYTTQVNAIGCLKILEKIKNLSKIKKIKFYQSSTSEMYGNTDQKKQNENTRFNPQSPYAISKLFAHNLTKFYRETFNLHASNGILFNHESPRRGETFVTRKIVIGIKNLLSKKIKTLYLGNIYAKRDWGHAKEYCEMQYKIMQLKKPTDIVISTGKSYSIKYFIEKCFEEIEIKIKWKGKNLNEYAQISKINNKKIKNLKIGQKVIAVHKKYFRASDVNYLKGDSSKARKLLNWKPKINIKRLVKDMIHSELNGDVEN
tara:strand:+ start:522 stop:1598 length:1077 start_codon:yes stop_codon:yes gene_type:complete